MWAEREENLARRKIKTAKKEENFSVNLLKKMAAKKIHFQTARFAGIRSRPCQKRGQTIYFFVFHMPKLP
jgi:hypothetical protein